LYLNVKNKRGSDGNFLPRKARRVKPSKND